jgi:hypothetical protein
MGIKRTITSAVGLFVLAACATINEPRAHTPTATEQVALDIVNRRIAAYNAHDIEAFLAAYDEHVRIVVYPDRVLGEGRERMRRIFGPQFARGEGRIEVLGQHVLENHVVSDENITIGARDDRNIAIYTINGGLIVEVRLIEKPRQGLAENP